MIIPGNEMPNGWPLGLGNLNSRIRAADSNSSQQTPPHHQPRAAPRILRSGSSSSSSSSSSNLDTESTASFFPDQSVSFGRLIGMWPPANNPRGRCLYDEVHMRDISSSDDNVGLRKTHHQQGICAPLLYHVIGRMTRTGSSSRH